MPIFEFKCASCGAKFETLVPSAKVTSAKCPGCGSAKTSKQLSVFGGIKMAGAGKECPAAPQCGGSGGHSCCAGKCPHH